MPVRLVLFLACAFFAAFLTFPPASLDDRAGVAAGHFASAALHVVSTASVQEAPPEDAPRPPSPRHDVLDDATGAEDADDDAPNDILAPMRASRRAFAPPTLRLGSAMRHALGPSSEATNLLERPPKAPLARAPFAEREAGHAPS